MTDSLTYKASKSITNHTGTELALLRPSRGGDTHQVKRWWTVGKAVYIEAAIFSVATTVGELKLILAIDPETTEVDILHDGKGNFTFPKHRGIKKAAVMSADYLTLYTDYLFPSISYEKVDKKEITSLPEEILIGNVVISGDINVNTGTGNEVDYTASITGNADDIIYTITTTGASATVTAENKYTGEFTLRFNEDGVTLIEVTATSTKTTPASNTGTLVTTATTTFATRYANVNTAYTVTLSNNVLALNGTEQLAVTMTSNQSIGFDYSGIVETNHVIKIYTDANKTTLVTVGVYEEGNKLVFEPPIAGTFSYQCANHSGEGGSITVS